MGGSYYPIPCLILSTRKDHKTPQRYPNVPTTSWRIFIRSMDSFQGLTLKSRSSWHRSLASNLIFNDHISFHLKCWDDIKELVKPVKAIATPQGIAKTPDQRLLELEDQINFLLKGSRPTPLSSSTHNPQAYVNAAYLSSHPKNQNESPILNSFAFRECTGLAPQPQALETTFEARREEINGRMTEMSGLLKELTTSKAPEKVLIREEVRSPVIKNINSISLVGKEEEENDKHNVVIGNTDKGTNGTNIEVLVKEAEAKNKAKNGHRINEKLIEGLVDNPRFNDSGTRVGKVKGKTYNVSPKGPMYDAILKKKITKKEDIRGNFEIPCSTGGLKNVNALVDQGPTLDRSSSCSDITTQVNKITTSCEICNGPCDTQYCMEDPEQAFVEYASLRTDEAGGKWYTFKPEQNNLGDTYNPSWRSHPNLSLEGLVTNFMASQDARLSKFEADFKRKQGEMANKIDTVLKTITDQITGTLPSNTVKNLKLSTSPVLSARSYPIEDP
ncbi:hypothetical protein Tco_1375942 [Tanacetum coccineum]